jgi:hypothetical protein
MRDLSTLYTQTALSEQADSTGGRWVIDVGTVRVPLGTWRHRRGR